MDSKELKQFRTKLYTDLYSNVIPESVPVQDGISIEFLIQYAGKSLLKTQYEYSVELLMEIYEKGLAAKYPEFKSKYILSFDEYKKEYPPVSDEVEPLMRKAYEKYLSKVALLRS